MKTSLLLIGLSVSTASLTSVPVAAAENETPYLPTLRSAHETVWQRLEWRTNQMGEAAVVRTNEFVELATGQNFFDEVTQAWKSSREEWQVYPDAIVAQAGGHKVILATNLNLGGSVDVLLPSMEGRPPVRLMMNPVGIGIYDPVDGKHQMLAEIKDCAPQWGAATNEIVFRDCFLGTRGSIRLLYTRAGVHQHIALEQRLELPEGFSDRSRLECYTEFAPNTPWPRITTRVLRRENDPVLRAQMVEPDFTDSQLDFGELAMRAGKAFTLGETNDARRIRVGKRFEMIGSRPVLTESVEFKQLEPLLAGLAAVERPKTGLFAANSSRQIKRATTEARLPREHFRALDRAKEIQLASSPLSKPAAVIDYELLSSATNYTFKGDTTYYVSGFVVLSGTTTLEGGAVIKYTNRTSAVILLDNLNCKTSPYRPAIFTSKDDNTVGDTLPGSTGSPTNYPGGAYITSSTTNTYTHLRMSYAGNGIQVETADMNIWHCQFFRCNEAIFATDYGYVNLHNVLFSRCGTAVSYSDGVKGEHVTADQTTTFLTGASGVLTNSILTAVTNLGVTLYNSATNSSGTGIFQTVGAGAYYLANSSTNRNAGTTNVNATLLADLQNKTTYPPVEITTNITGNTTLSTYATRDTDIPDRGYHYDPLDAVISSITLTNATLTLTNGVVLGTRPGANSNPGILYIRNSGKLISEGSPTRPNVLARYLSVQEGSTTNAVNNDAFVYLDSNAGNTEIRCRFTDWWAPSGSGKHLTIYNINAPYSFRDSRFGGSSLFLKGTPVALTNCLWERVWLNLNDDEETVDRFIYNNFFRGGTLTLVRNGSGVSRVYDTLFDATTIEQTGTITHDYNGYVGEQTRLTPDGEHDQPEPSLSYQQGPLGDFYLPHFNGLNNVGSRDAFTAGLYHYTTKITQAMESNSIVDIGFHYIVVSNGVALDADTDGIPDYADADSDSNDGLPDIWEQQYFGTLAEGVSGDFDGDCLTNLFEYQQGTNVPDQPTVTSAPVYQITPIGANAFFSVTTAQACLNYQWYREGVLIPGATNASLTLTSVQLSSNGLYRVRAFRGVSTNVDARLVVLEASAWTIWTNHIAQTNNKSINLWTNGNPGVIWNTNCVLYGKTGYTAISLSNSFQGTQARVTALTRRHGYTAGHSLSPITYDDFGGHTGTKVWFLTADNQVHEATVAIAYVHRTFSPYYDYALFIFSNNLPTNITPMAVMNTPSSVGVQFRTGQFNYMSANMPPFAFGQDTSRPPFNELSTFFLGDSGSPNMIPTTDGSLVFIEGTTSSGPSDQMQIDMNKLTLYLNLNTNDYRLNWHTNYP